MRIWWHTASWRSCRRRTGEAFVEGLSCYIGMSACSGSQHTRASFTNTVHASCTRSRVSYSQERHLFHIVVRDGITFLCMADEVSASTIHQLYWCAQLPDRQGCDCASVQNHH